MYKKVYAGLAVCALAASHLVASTTNDQVVAATPKSCTDLMKADNINILTDTTQKGANATTANVCVIDINGKPLTNTLVDLKYSNKSQHSLTTDQYGFLTISSTFPAQDNRLTVSYGNTECIINTYKTEKTEYRNENDQLTGTFSAGCNLKEQSVSSSYNSIVTSLPATPTQSSSLPISSASNPASSSPSSQISSTSSNTPAINDKSITVRVVDQDGNPIDLERVVLTSSEISLDDPINPCITQTLNGECSFHTAKDIENFTLTATGKCNVSKNFNINDFEMFENRQVYVLTCQMQPASSSSTSTIFSSVSSSSSDISSSSTPVSSQSSSTVVTPSGYTITARVVDRDGTAIGNQTVTFTAPNMNVPGPMNPCNTQDMSGTCSIDIGNSTPTFTLATTGRCNVTKTFNLGDTVEFEGRQVYLLTCEEEVLGWTGSSSSANTNSSSTDVSTSSSVSSQNNVNSSSQNSSSSITEEVMGWENSSSTVSSASSNLSNVSTVSSKTTNEEVLGWTNNSNKLPQAGGVNVLLPLMMIGGGVTLLATRKTSKQNN